MEDGGGNLAGGQTIEVIHVDSDQPYVDKQNSKFFILYLVTYTIPLFQTVLTVFGLIHSTSLLLSLENEAGWVEFPVKLEVERLPSKLKLPLPATEPLSGYICWLSSRHQTPTS